MGKKKKRKFNNILISVPGSPYENSRQIKIRKTLIFILTTVLCLVVGIAFGIYAFEAEIYDQVRERTFEFKEKIETLETSVDELKKENASAQSEIAVLNGEVELLSENLIQKTQHEEQLSEVIDSWYIPTLFPVSTSSSMTVEMDTSLNLETLVESTNPICLFVTQINTLVLSSAGGVVEMVAEDNSFGYCIVVNHQNGYKTIYRAEGTVLVGEGQTVYPNDTLMLITDDEGTLGFQMIYGEEYIDPSSLLEIEG